MCCINRKLTVLLFLALIAVNVSKSSSAETINALSNSTTPLNVEKQLKRLETSSGGKLGIVAINTKNKEVIYYNAKKPFPLCSTSKIMTVAAILKKSMTNKNLLQKKIRYSKKELEASGYAPSTQKHLVEGMTIAELCKATITQSDNAAANILMKVLGGPKAVTRFARSIGDEHFRLDRWEPALNSAIPGDLRDTTTPLAMAKSLQRLVLGNTLAVQQREQLKTWLIANATGNARIRAGTPKNWLVGDKTGTGAYGTTNDIAILWPPKCPPIIMVVYFTQHKKLAEPMEGIVASASHTVIKAFSCSEK